MGKEARRGRHYNLNDSARQIDLITHQVSEAGQHAKSFDELLRLFEKSYALVERLDAQAHAEHAARHGYEGLRTDTRDGRSAEWFTQTGKTFSLGHATRCIVVGFAHEDIGFAEAHRNTVTVLDTAQQAWNARERFSGGLRMRTNNEITNEERLKAIIHDAVAQATEEFVTLAPEGIPAGTQAFAYGISTASPENVPFYRVVVRKAIKNHPLTKDIPVDATNVGKAGSLFYGGKNHPKYNTPTFLRSLAQV